MSYIQGKFSILEKKEIAENIVDLRILSPEIAKSCRAGQFVHIKVDGFFLRRPISICERVDDSIRIVFAIKGGGTKKLSELTLKDKIDIMGPVGNGFKIDKDKKAVMVGGGIGVPPLLEAVKGFSPDSAAILGFQSKKAVILEEDFKTVCKSTVICTDDGSYGQKGLVTHALENYLASEGAPDVICACGPALMLKSVAEIAKKHGIPCQVSLEERMACGLGACLGCAVKINREGKEFFAHVCKDGPVFDSREVVFDG